MLWGGQRILNLAAGDTAFSDPAFEFAGGDTAWLRWYLNVASLTSGWPVWRTPRATGEGFTQSVGGANQAYGLGTLSAAGGSNGAGWAPQGVIGIPHADSPEWTRRAVICDGDSIIAGTGDTADTATGNIAYSKGLVDRDGYLIPYVNQGRAQDQLSFQVDANLTPRWRKQLMWAYATHYLCNFGTNDIANGRTLSQMQADAAYVWGRARKYGLKVAQILVTPRQLSVGGAVHSDWAPGGLRDQWNAWVRTQVGVLIDDVIDPNPYVESATTHGAWASDTYTPDGLHMLPAGYAAANQAVTAWAQTRVAV
nr:SGNH/GDSL hydrolase family protein [Siccirubricoccus soli]